MYYLSVSLTYRGQAGFKFAECSQSFYQGRLMNFGAWNECALNGNTSHCSFYSKLFECFSALLSANSVGVDKEAQAASKGSAEAASLEEIMATNTAARPQHPSNMSPRARANSIQSNRAQASSGSPMRISSNSPPGSIAGVLAIGGGRERNNVMNIPMLKALFLHATKNDKTC